MHSTDKLRDQLRDLIDKDGAVIIPEGVKSIPNSTFEGYRELKKIVLPSSLVTINDFAFSRCVNLESISLPEGLQKIGYYAFESCHKLKSIVIPPFVSTIKDNPFRGCRGLKNIMVDTNNPFFDSRNNCNAIIETKRNKLIVGCSKTKTPLSVKVFGCQSFMYVNIKSLKISKNVKKIEGQSFLYNKLKSVEVDSRNKFFDSRDNCNAIIETKTNRLILGCDTTRIPDSIISIGEYAFAGSEIESIVIPDSVEKIEPYAFSDCKNLNKAIILNDNIKIDHSSFLWCDKLTHI